MAKGENIFKRKDGRWEARYIKGYDLSGKIRYGFCYGRNYRDAKEKVTKCKAAILAGKQIPQVGSHHRFSFFCDEWLQSRKGKIRESTYIKYDTILKKHIKPKLGSCFPTGITMGIVNTFTQELMVKDGLAAKTTHDILVVLNSIFRYASIHLSGVFPTIDISYPKEIRKETRILSLEEQERFVKHLLTDIDACKFGVLLMLLSGVRIGELCALKWENINMDELTIHITATLQRLHNTEAESGKRTRIVIGAPKSDTSVRVIPLTDSAVKLCRKLTVCNPNAYILTGTEKYMEPRTLQYRIKKYTRECGLDGIHAHTLRHTFATRAVEVGFEIKSLSEILGHANTTITLNRYVHSSMELKRANMNKLASVGL